MGRQSEYAIRADYVPNPVPARREGRYWNARRIRRAAYYQHGVYGLAIGLVRRHGSRTVVDIGCGVGVKLARLHRACPDVRIVGLDLPEAIEVCRRIHAFGEWHEVDLASAEIETPRIRGDLVIVADVIEHVADPDRLLSGVRRCLQPGGRLPISTPEREALRGPRCLSCPNPEHVREWSFAEFRSYLESRGWAVREHLLQLPVRIGPSPVVFAEIVRRWLARRPLRYNQVCVAEVA